MSDVLCQMSDVTHLISDVLCLLSDVRHPMFVCLLSDVRCLFDVKCLTSDNKRHI